jgi:hypothetical protein
MMVATLKQRKQRHQLPSNHSVDGVWQHELCGEDAMHEEFAAS